MRVLGVDVGAVFHQHFDYFEREIVGCRRVHQGSSSQRIDDVDVGSVVEQRLHGIHVASNGDVGQRQAVVLLVDLLGGQQRQAFGALHGNGHVDGHLADRFHFRTLADEHFHAGGVAGGGGFQQRGRIGGGLRAGSVGGAPL